MKSCQNCESPLDRHGDLCNRCFWDAKSTEALEKEGQFYDWVETEATKNMKQGDYTKARLIPHYAKQASVIESILSHRKQK